MSRQKAPTAEAALKPLVLDVPRDAAEDDDHPLVDFLLDHGIPLVVVIVSAVAVVVTWPLLLT